MFVNNSSRHLMLTLSLVLYKLLHIHTYFFAVKTLSRYLLYFTSSFRQKKRQRIVDYFVSDYADKK